MGIAVSIWIMGLLHHQWMLFLNRELSGLSSSENSRMKKPFVPRSVCGILDEVELISFTRRVENEKDDDDRCVIDDCFTCVCKEIL
jgi:hypothetical protein